MFDRIKCMECVLFNNEKDKKLQETDSAFEVVEEMIEWANNCYKNNADCPQREENGK